MRKIFTLLAAFLAIAGSAVWGQTTHKVGVSADSRNVKYEGPTEVNDGDSLSFTISGVDGYGDAKFKLMSLSITMDGEWLAHTNSNDPTGGGNEWWNLPVTFTSSVPITGDVEFSGDCYAVVYDTFDQEDYFFDPADQHIIVYTSGIPNSSYTVADIQSKMEFQGKTYPVKTIVRLHSDYLEKIIIPSSVDTISRGAFDLNKDNIIIEFESTELPVLEDNSTSVDEARVVVPDEETKKKYQRMRDTEWSNANIFTKGEDLTKKVYERKDDWRWDILMNMQYVGPQKLKEGDVFLLDVSDNIDIKDGEKLLLFDSHKGNFEYEIVDGKKELPIEVKVTKIPAGVETLEFEAEAYVKVQEQSPITYYYNPGNTRNSMMAVATGQTDEEVVELLTDIVYDGTYLLRRIYDVKGLNAKKLVIPHSVREIDENALGSNWESVEFLGENLPECGNNNPGLNDNCIIIVMNESVKADFEASEAFGKYKIEVKGEEEPELPERISFNYDYVENGTIKIAYSDKIPAAYDTIPVGTSAIQLFAEPMLGYKLEGKIKVVVPPLEGVEYENGDVVMLSSTTDFIAIEATFVKDEAMEDDVKSIVEGAPALATEGTLEEVASPTLIAESTDFNTDDDTGISIKLVVVGSGTGENYINAYTAAEGEIGFEYENTYELDIAPMYITSDGTIKEATVSAPDGVSVAFPYPEGLGADDFEDIAVLHMKKNGEFEYFSEENNNLERKETHIELSGITSFSPFVLIYTKAEVDPEPEIPEFTTYYDLHITQSVGAKLVSRHGKDQVEEGGSFTLSLEKEEGYEDCNPTVYVKRGRSGEWQEVELDEVSGYYQIRDVYTDIYVKVSGDGIYPVGNESIETSDTKVYSLNGKIVVETAQPKEVYVVTLAGAVVANAQVVGKQTFDNLATGVYIVRAGETIVKLQVRN